MKVVKTKIIAASMIWLSCWTVTVWCAIGLSVGALSSREAFAQTVNERSASQVFSSVPQLAETASTPSSTEFTIRWSVNADAVGGVAPTPSSSPEPSKFELVASRLVDAVPPLERDPQLSSDVLVIIALDADGAELGWQQVKDPRVVRAEEPGPGGTLTGQVLFRPLTEFVVSVPIGVSVATLRVYQTRWTGQSFALVLLGSVAVTP